MTRFQPEHFTRASSMLGQVWMHIQAGSPPSENGLSAIAGELGNLEKKCQEFSLASTLAQIRRVKTVFMTGKMEMSWPAFSRELLEVQLRLNDELAAIFFFTVSFEKADYLSAFSSDAYAANGNAANRVMEIWEPIFAKFPSTKFDGTEALRSFALGRNTAAVFHLMRVLEIGLGVLGGVFGVSLAHTNWNPAIEQIESLIREMHKDPKWKALPDCKEQQEFYAQAASHFGIFKDAWRNYTAHARGKYDEQEAADVMTGVRAFMQKLAARLHE